MSEPLISEPEVADLAGWVADEIGQKPASHRVIEGGLTAVVHRFGFAEHDDVIVKVVSQVGEENELLASRECTGLLAAAAIDSLPTPALIARRNKTELMMSAMSGDRVLAAIDLIDRLQPLAETVASIHQHSVDPEVANLETWQPWGPTASLIPDGQPSDGPWGELSTRWDSLHQPDGPTRLLHRDLQPLNLLWDGRTITGVIDWANCCVGHPHADLSHLRWNLAVLAGQDAADELLERYLDMTDFGPYDHYWDLATIKGLGNFAGEGAGWHAAGRTDLTRRDVVDATKRFCSEALRQESP